MRYIIATLAAAGSLYAASIAVPAPAEAAVACAKGVYRAGCVRTAPVAAPAHGAVCRRWGVVGGVRRCVLY
jgi:hypothetical protein